MLRFLTAGESHGPELIAVIEGSPAGFPIEVGAINHDLARRQKGYGRGGRMLIEKDEVRVVSGIRFGRTTGSPVTFIIENRDYKNWEKRPNAHGVTLPTKINFPITVPLMTDNNKADPKTEKSGWELSA